AMLVSAMAIAETLFFSALAPVIPWVDQRWLLSTCVVVAVSSYGVLFGPAMALASQVYEREEVAPVFGFAFIGLMFASGFFVGSAAGGEIAHHERRDGVRARGRRMPRDRWWAGTSPALGRATRVARSLAALPQRARSISPSRLTDA